MSKHQFNCKLSDGVKEQIRRLSVDYGISQAEVVSLSIERLCASLKNDPAYIDVKESLKQKTH